MWLQIKWVLLILCLRKKGMEEINFRKTQLCIFLQNMRAEMLWFGGWRTRRMGDKCLFLLCLFLLLKPTSQWLPVWTPNKQWKLHRTWYISAKKIVWICKWCCSQKCGCALWQCSSLLFPCLCVVCKLTLFLNAAALCLSLRQVGWLENWY